MSDQVFQVDAHDLLDLYNGRLEYEIKKVSRELYLYRMQPQQTKEGERKIHERREVFETAKRINESLRPIMVNEVMKVALVSVDKTLHTV